MTQIIETITEWRNICQSEKFQHKTVGFVPTMGALHAGHQSLLQRCRVENDLAVLSIFVNPTQFDDPNDLQRYPKTFAEDLALATTEEIDYIFFPSAKEIYADSYRYKISENTLSNQLCGQHRPGHFDGVLTVVMKLLQLIKPQRAYFGEKDYQQYELIKGMVTAFFLDCEIVPCPIIRADDGLALSSRNKLLTESERASAINFPELLQAKLSAAEVHKQLESLGFIVDYIEELNGRRFGAVRIGNIRLIDNVAK